MNVMTIKIDTDTGELLKVLDNKDKEVTGIDLAEKSSDAAKLKDVPMSRKNFSKVVFSYTSTKGGCVCYIHDGKRYCVPQG